MTEKLMETACARLCLLTRIAWDSSLPPVLTRPAVHRLIESGALSGLVLREAPGISKTLLNRAEALLARAGDAFLQMKAYEKRGYRVLLPEEKYWPTALHKLGDQEPLFLFTKGNQSLLKKQTVALAGSRKINSQTEQIAAQFGETFAREKIVMACGGANGVDRAAQDTLLNAGGSLILVPAVDADHAGIRVNERKAMANKRVLLLCETLPDTPFSAQKALTRNHTIYALGRAAIVIASRKGTGGSWRGATDCLRGGFAPVYTLDEEGDDFEGNRALLVDYGARKINKQESVRKQLNLKMPKTRNLRCK